MKQTTLSALSTSDLVQTFIEKGLGASAADAVLDNEQANRLHRETHNIGSEITRRGSAAQSTLVPLLDHPDECVRMMAAVYAHPIAPERSHRVLVDLSAHGNLPYRFLVDAYLDELGYEGRFSKARSSPS